MFGQKKTNDSYVENKIFQKLGEYPLNITHMLNILPAKNKCNIVNYKLNVYKTSTKQPYLSIVEHYTKYQFSESGTVKIGNISL